MGYSPFMPATQLLSGRSVFRTNHLGIYLPSRQQSRPDPLSNAEQGC